MNLNRTGKIARLPRTVRDTLNRRLLDGEPGPRLVKWLNGQADVKQVLAADFAGRAITVQNLSEWRQGGLPDWSRQQQALTLLGQTLEEAKELETACGVTPLTDRAAEALALALLGQLRMAGAMPEGPAKLRATLAVVGALVRLRRSDREYQRAYRENAEADRVSARTAAQEQLRSEQHLASYSGDLRRYYQAVRDVMAEEGAVPAPVLEFFAGEAEFEHRHAEALRKLGNYLHCRRHNLPPGAEWSKPVAPSATPVAPVPPIAPPPGAPATASDSVAVNPTKSDQIQPLTPVTPVQPVVPVAPGAPAAAPAAVAPVAPVVPPAPVVAPAAAPAVAQSGSIGVNPTLLRESLSRSASEGTAKSDQIQPNPSKSDQIQPLESAPVDQTVYYGWERGFDMTKTKRFG